MSVEAFCNYDHVVVSPTGRSFEGPTDRALTRLRRRRHVRYSVPASCCCPKSCRPTTSSPSFVAATDGDERPGAVEPPVDVPGFDVIAVWHSSSDKDAAHRWLRGRLAEIIG